MSILSWNYREAGNPSAIRALRELVRSYRPVILFLMETKVHGRRMEVLRSQLSFAHCFSVDSIGIGGGLSIFWSTDIQLHVSSYSSNFIDCEIRSDGTQWRLTGFYGFPDRTRRRLPWLCCGDFNDIAALYEKLGGPPCSTVEWSSLFRDAICSVLVAPVSYHSPLLIGTASTSSEGVNRRFCFDNSWLSEPDLGETVDRAWAAGATLSFSDRISLVVDHIRLWGKQRNRLRWAQKETIKRRLGEDQHTIDPAEIRRLKGQWNAILEAEDVRLKQQAKAFWFRHGEKNTKYFHNSIKARRKRNRITKLTDDAGNVTSDEPAICGMIHTYFSNLFQAAESSTGEVLRLVKPLVDESANNALIAPFSDEEFRNALFQMEPNKASGPDGLNPAFFQKFWSIIGGDICQACREWLQLGALPPSLATTLIVLIPKCDNPLHVTEFRSIALCNVIYKILSKALATRLKSLLPTIISLNQSAFVPGRLITDNFIVASETLHGLKQRSRGNSGSCALKIDIAKAYDRVSWDYLLAMLTALGFSAVWIKWMRICISNISYMISVNGTEVGPIISSRGLRQGDPLSPYLFLIVAEGLSLLLKDGERRGVIHGCRARLGCLRISHLFFADHSLLFFNGTVSEATQVKHILGIYEAASGQSINYGKSGILFSLCIALDVKQAISTLLGVHLPLGQSHYLGLPSLLGRSKKQIFSFLKDRIWKRINNWNNRFLSWAGREILIKAIIQAIPTYCMNVFLILATTCFELQSMGGMGFRDLRCFNTALLGKQGWRLIVDTTTLSYQVLKAKYFPRGDFLTARLGTNYSFVWRSVLFAQRVLLRGVRWRVRDGQHILVNRDPWILKVGGFHPDDGPMAIPTAMRVCDLFFPGERQWDPAKLLSYFSIDDVHAILGIPLSIRPIPDKLICICDRRGIYSVKTAYYEAHEDLGDRRQRVQGFVWKRIWSLDVPPKVRDFLWRCCRDVLPTKDNLQLRGVNVDLHYLFCHEHESMQHVFLDCPIAKELWRLAGLAWKLWLARNDKFWHDKRVTPHQIHIQANSYYSDLQAIMSGGTTRTVAFPLPLCFRAAAAMTLSSHWLAFIDGSIFAEAGLLGFGILFEDGEGSFSLALSGYEDDNDSLAMAEALALRQCLLFARDEMLQAGSIFTDNQLLIHFGLIISDCKAILCTRNNISVSWIRRSENGGAHSLARAYLFSIAVFRCGLIYLPVFWIIIPRDNSYFQ
ncbi:hypothetical protein K2173_002326 [Erythroxylum novogranatense]|uniref:Reverse transcriptase domain-containing protein n=1 Tax=Erythroxylum novogranatense TaxID=1862640 RepID=A0AAV8TBB6_9ROSI|nr:hypothetical protein K2173_002326 [Erythroxylum novogranatense]